MDESTIKRFEKFVVKNNKKDECWGWSGAPCPKGYARLYFEGISFGAHRISWMIYNGDIPVKMCVLRKCNSRLCTRPEHLYLASHPQYITNLKKKNHSLNTSRYGRKRLHVDIPNGIYSYLQFVTKERNCTITKYVLRMLVEKLSQERKKII